MSMVARRERVVDRPDLQPQAAVADVDDARVVVARCRARTFTCFRGQRRTTRDDCGNALLASRRSRAQGTVSRRPAA